MATFNAIELEFMAALDSNPEFREAVRSRLLTRELLELPQTVRELAETVRLQSETTNRRLDALETGQIETNRRLDALETGQIETNRRLEALEDGQLETNRRLEALEDGQLETNRRLGFLETTLHQFMEASKQFMEASNQRYDKLDATLQQFIEATDQRFEKLESDVDGMRGDHLEMRLQGRIHSILGSGRGIYGVRVIRATFPAGSAPEFIDRADEAAMDGIITQGQYGRIMNTDLIVCARRGRDFDQDLYVAVEVANQLDGDDIGRVVDSGAALALLFPHSEIMTAVYGRVISDIDLELAHKKGVDVFITRDRR